MAKKKRLKQTSVSASRIPPEPGQPSNSAVNGGGGSGISTTRRSREGMAAKYAVYATLAGLCLLIYGRVVGYDFINIDDDHYIYLNPNVSGGFNAANALWAFTSFHASNWHPLTWISHQIDSSLFGAYAGGHHFVNVIFHAANSILVFVVINRLTGAFWRSAMVAAVFAVHPAHIESVAWVAERKDVLSTLFWLLTTIFYIRYARSSNKTNDYGIALVLFACGLMAKPMLVTLPFTLILLDYWALERFEKWNFESVYPLVKEKLPFFLLSIISAIVTIFAQGSGGAIQTVQRIPLSDRAINAVVSYADYVAMLFYPANLGAWYPYDGDIGAAQVAASVAVVAGISAFAVWQVRSRKYFFVGWFWFLGTLVPVIGLLQVGRQSLADRYTYVPYIGLSIAFVWLFAEVFERFKLNRVAVRVVAGFVVAVLSMTAFWQVSHWRNTETISLHTLSVTENNYFIEHNYCHYLESRNRLDEAIKYCNSAIEHDPELAEGYNTLGSIFLKQNNLAQAQQNLQKAIELRPQFAMAHANLAIVKIRNGEFGQAGKSLDRGIEVDTEGFFDAARKLEAFSAVGLEALKAKEYSTAETYLRRSNEIDPNNLDVQRNLAIALYSQRKSPEAIEILQRAIGQWPNSPEVYNSLGLIYAEQNRRREAAEMFQRALSIDPGFAPARNNLSQLGAGTP